MTPAMRQSKPRTPAISPGSTVSSSSKTAPATSSVITHAMRAMFMRANGCGKRNKGPAIPIVALPTFSLLWYAATMSHELTREPNTDPTQIYRYRDGLYAEDMLIVGIVWLDLFSWLATKPSDLRGVMQQFEITERPADVMLTLFVA